MTATATLSVPMDPIVRLSRDLKLASVTLSPHEVRFIVDAYYIAQENRKRADNQVRSMAEEPHEVIGWLAANNDVLERNILRALSAYTDNHPVGAWLKCAPPGSRVLVDSGRWGKGATIPIEELQSGTPVVGFNRHHAHLTLPTPSRVAMSQHNGLIVGIAHVRAPNPGSSHYL